MLPTPRAEGNVTLGTPVSTAVAVDQLPSVSTSGYLRQPVENVAQDHRQRHIDVDDRRTAASHPRSWSHFAGLVVLVQVLLVVPTG
jgi:hypothetical protein